MVHDKNETASECCSGVHHHRFPGNSAHLGNDQRWTYIRDALASGAVQWECAYVVDFDVSVLCLPPCEAPSPGTRQKLIMSGELCQILPKQWLYARSTRMGLNNLRSSLPWWNNISRLLHDQRPMVNCGVVGGHRSSFEPALDAVVAAYQRLWRLRPKALDWAGTDMLVWNGVALEHGLHEGGVVSGYPHGPVTLPLDGKLAAHSDGEPAFELCLNIQHNDSATGGPCTSRACILDWASNVSLNRYYVY